MDKLKVIVGLCIVALLLSFSIFEYYHVTTVTGTVEEKYTKRSKDYDRFYIVVKDKNDVEHVIVNKDSVFMLKWDSADVQAQVKVGKEYKVEMRGFRVPFLSMYPNVDNIKEIKTKGEK